MNERLDSIHNHSRTQQGFEKLEFRGLPQYLTRVERVRFAAYGVYPGVNVIVIPALQCGCVINTGSLDISLVVIRVLP